MYQSVNKHAGHGDPNQQDESKTQVDENQVNNIFQNGHQKNNDKYHFDRINRRMEWEMLKIKLANRANLSMAKAGNLFHEVSQSERNVMQFAFAKYQWCKMN